MAERRQVIRNAQDVGLLIALPPLLDFVGTRQLLPQAQTAGLHYTCHRVLPLLADAVQENAEETLDHFIVDALG